MLNAHLVDFTASLTRVHRQRKLGLTESMSQLCRKAGLIIVIAPTSLLPKFQSAPNFVDCFELKLIYRECESDHGNRDCTPPAGTTG